MPQQENMPVNIHINTGNNKTNAKDAKTARAKKDVETQSSDPALQSLLMLERQLKKALKEQNDNIREIKEKKSDRKQFISSIPFFVILTTASSYIAYLLIASMLVPLIAMGGEFVVFAVFIVMAVGAFAALAMVGPSLAITETPKFIDKGKEIKELEKANVTLDKVIPDLESALDEINSQIKAESRENEQNKGREMKIKGNYISSEDEKKPETGSQTESGPQYIEVETKDPPSGKVRGSTATQTEYVDIKHKESSVGKGGKG
ncbi:hypothetical protein RLOatenuis_6870 [Rickettsiales bacterium]|nr:hypothetical protein RLOatenuis_6870 [Rickettsiales bacterium]